MAARVTILNFWSEQFLTIFNLQVILIIPIKFRVNWSFYSGEVQNRFSRWRLWWPYWISDQNNFSYFWSTSHPDTSYQVSNGLAFWFRRRSSKQISRWQPWQPFRISTRNDEAIFDLQVTLILPTKFQFNWPLCPREEIQYRFSRWRLWWPSWISNRNNL